jgi:hypothetical protein
VDREMIGMCGAYCGVCEWKPKMNCPGCHSAKGTMFYGQCNVALCAVEKGLHHCGLCPDMPCETLQQCFDHPEHGDRGERLANLKTWARGGETYLELRPLKKEGDEQPDRPGD